MTYADRAKHCINPTAFRLFTLMEKKQTNLCVAADVITKKELLHLADLIGPEICLFKTHIDIVEDFDDDLIIQLQRLAEKHNFLIFEDRKFADIGKTVQLQYEKGMYHIVDWAHITNAHTVAGHGSIDALKKIGFPKGRGLLVLAEMTPKGTLASGTYTEASIAIAQQHRDFVIGFITTRQLVEDPTFINMTPGVQITEGSDMFGQQFATPETVITKNKSDIIIVGRGITQAADPLIEAKRYREAGWQAYQKTFSQS